jgi:hypothetical protein
MAESAENLDALLLGDVSEGVKESDETFAARLAQAQQKIAQIKKDESFSKQYDQALAGILPSLSPALLDIVVFLLDEEISSLTIISVISLANGQAAQVAWEVFHKYIEEKADFSDLNVAKKHMEMLSYWWTFIVGAESISREKKLATNRNSEYFVKRFGQSLGVVLREFVHMYKLENLDQKRLKKIVVQYQTEIFR